MIHDKILGIGLFEDGFPLVRFYCEVFWELLDMKMPHIAEKLRSSHLSDDLWLFQWFITLFMYNFPFFHAKKFWEFIVCKK